MKRIILPCLVVLATWGLFGCGDDSCPVGKQGCRCQEDNGCDSGLLCQNGKCRVPECDSGTEGCVCALNDRCGVNSQGEQLVCQDGVCVSAECPPGGTGCLCAAGDACDAADDQCRDGFCQPTGCVPGELNCPCAGGSCSPGLACRDGAICVDNTGYLGGACRTDGSCNTGLRCQEGVCVPCTPGTQDCMCTSSGSCISGLRCVDNLCLHESQAPPDQPQCYTPCERGVVDDDGTYRECPADGLMPGCIGDLECIEGTCAEPGGSPATCSEDIDCPDFQACLAGQCYSNCDGNSDCPEGYVCYQHVCRVQCQIGEDECPLDYSCVSEDGEGGTCQQVADPGEESHKSVDGTFSLSQIAIDFSNVNTSEQIVITNDSPVFERFIVRKRSHTAYFDDGTSDEFDDRADDGVDCDPARDCPLFWMEMGEPGSTSRVQELEVGIEGNGGQVTIVLGGADESAAVRWDGRFEVIHPRLGKQFIITHYNEKPEGRWSGKIYYFAQFGDRELEAWRATQLTRDDEYLRQQVGNAFIHKWGAFRTGDIDWENLRAAMLSTRTGSYNWPSVTNDCHAGQNGACYPFDASALGLEIFSSDLDAAPIPSGVTELPFAANLRIPDPDTAPGLMTGRIESSKTLQYAGNPAITLDFGSDPAGCDRVTGGACLVFIDNFEADIFVGGRYESSQGDAGCSQRDPTDGYIQTKTPWLLPGFERATEVDQSNMLRYRYECRDSQLPLTNAAGQVTEELQAWNLSLAVSNPIPDGRTRRRSIRLVDGALVNQSLLVIIFEETFESFLPFVPNGDGGSSQGEFSAYGYMLLEKEAADLDQSDDNGNQIPDVYEGTIPTDDRIEPVGLLDVHCSADLLQDLVGVEQVEASNAVQVVLGMIDGVAREGGPAVITGASAEEVHYLCLETGLFDGGAGAVTPPTPAPNHNCCRTNVTDPATCDGNPSPYAGNNSCDDGGPDSDTAMCPVGTDFADCGFRNMGDGDDGRVSCPVGSNVVFFTVNKNQISQAQIAELDCQQDGSCEQQLYNWTVGGGPLVQVGPAWKCTDPNQVYCDSDRYDLRGGKDFYEYSEQYKVYPSLYSETDLAFRYKTRFRSRTGETVGFAPQICIPNSNQIPYCYDPPVIEKARERIDCLLHVWRYHYDALATPGDPDDPDRVEAKTKLDEYLCSNFSYTEACLPGFDPSATFVHDGFERLYAELLVMMGDESYTRAFASRFDLAGSNTVSFEGSLFEPGGINLSGAAGYEMFSLYQATQYFQEALDRFYAMSPLLSEALDCQADSQCDNSKNFVTPETVTWYFDRLIRASTQKSRAWSAAAERYQNFNRPDLARAVIERAYTSTYMESIVLAQLMIRITDQLQSEDRPGVIKVLEEGQLRFRMAMLDMRNNYDAITDNINFFGLPPDYIPFPTLNDFEHNGFEVIINRAKTKTANARLREIEALSQNREFETDAEAFQAELVRLRNTYEKQLGDICGTIVGEDGRIYPAIETYAYMNEETYEMGDPCGLVGGGSIYTSMAQFEIAEIDLRRILTRYDNLLQEIEIERQRADDICGIIMDLAKFVYGQQTGINNLRNDIRRSQFIINRLDRVLQKAETVAQMAKCSVGTSTDCPTAAAAATVFGITAARVEVDVSLLETDIWSAEKDIADLERETAYWQSAAGCSQEVVNSEARLAISWLQLREIELEALRAEYQVRLALSEIQKQYNEAKRVQLEMEEAQQFAINIQAARNDPNVRIYRNDAFLNADLSFKDAMREAYRATKVLEYYRSQSYAKLEQLFLIRMVQYGDYNLQNYLVDLENAYYDFEEEYGLPDTRVAILSLRDDIMRIPRTNEAGSAIPQAERIDMMRERLTDPGLLDENGYLTVPFSTNFEALSPLTRNHKIYYMEAEFIGSDVGDTVGRVYLRQQGTSVINGLESEKLYYRFPERVAVLNPFFNGNRFFDPEVYKSYRLRDRPYVNTSWELILNQRDEQANQDIDLQSLTDIRLFVFYNDFTEF